MRNIEADLTRFLGRKAFVGFSADPVQLAVDFQLYLDDRPLTSGYRVVDTLTVYWASRAAPPPEAISLAAAGATPPGHFKVSFRRF